MLKVILAGAFVLFAIGLVLFRSTSHVIREGHIGVYYRGGALLEGYTEPGLNFKLPFITSYEEVQVTIQTDSVKNIPCGTSEGTMIYFDKVEVVNRLQKEAAIDLIRNYTTNYDQTWIFDKIHHEINQFCSKHTLQEVYIELFDTLDEALADALQESVNKWAPGLRIIAVRVTKPKIPEEVQKTYEQMSQQAAELRKALLQKKVILQHAETMKEKSMIKQKQLQAEASVKLEMRIQEKEAEAKISKINDEIAFNKRKRETDSTNYAAMKEAEANRARFTPEFLEYTRLTALKDNTKIYFGDKIPSMMPFPTTSPSDEQKISSEDTCTA